MATKSYLHRLFPDDTIIIPATKGTGTLWNSQVFGYKESDLKDLVLPSEPTPTPEMLVSVNEQVENGDGTFARIYGSLHVDLSRLCLSQEQIKIFVRDPHLRHYLQPDGSYTFFVFTKKYGEPVNYKRSNLSIAAVSLDDNIPAVYHNSYISDHPWNAEKKYRFVLPEPMKA